MTAPAVCAHAATYLVKMSRHPLWISVLALAGCAPGGEMPRPDGQTITVLDYAATVPSDWDSLAPTSTMRLAEFRVPDAGEGGADVVVYHFGAGQGGSVAANTERWTAQFFDADGGHPEPETERIAGTHFPTTMVTLEGAYARTIGMGGTAADAVPGQMLLAAVVETPQGNLYVQMHGPRAAVRAARGSFLAFLRSIGPAAATGTPG